MDSSRSPSGARADPGTVELLLDALTDAPPDGGVEIGDLSPDGPSFGTSVVVTSEMIAVEEAFDRATPEEATALESKLRHLEEQMERTRMRLEVIVRQPGRIAPAARRPYCRGRARSTLHSGRPSSRPARRVTSRSAGGGSSADPDLDGEHDVEGRSRTTPPVGARMSAGRTEPLAVPLTNYLTALLLRSARGAELSIQAYAARVEASWDGCETDLEAFRALAGAAERVAP